MIPKETIDDIFNAARIEEVVGDFVRLKKQGANYMGLCPFHDDRSPSMSVSPVKGIYKCFSCGASGNTISFLMDHEQITYPEALKILAKKYNIQIVEEEIDSEQQQKINEKESMLLVSEFAAKNFHENLLQSDEGKSVGLSYIKNRGISDEMIEKFNLGYALEERDAFTKTAVGKGYDLKFLESTGLSITKNSSFDRFAGRVIFPIFNISGRTIGFGARTLSSEKKIAKYLNSPESEIYHKSKVLYGLFQAKKAIAKEDVCILVEGYTDVISLHQKGVENVVASSGTALTVEQIKLIKRFTNNIILALDGDAAGQKAAIRGVDLILKEDLNVKVVAFPEGEDPDSFAKSKPSEELKKYIQQNAVDFITYKCNLLLSSAGNDPILRAQVIKDVVSSIALIPDAINRNVYAQSASKILDIDEKVILADLAKKRAIIIQGDSRPELDNTDELAPQLKQILEEKAISTPIEISENTAKVAKKIHERIVYNEENIIRLLISYGYLPIYFKNKSQEDEVRVFVVEFVINEIVNDDLKFEVSLFQDIFDEIQILCNNNEVPSEKYFFQHKNPEIMKKVIEICAEKYKLSEGWKDKKIIVPNEVDNLKQATLILVNRFKLDKVLLMIESIQEKLQENPENIDELLNDFSELTRVKISISQKIGRLIG
jgi:DNA primase